MKFFSLHTLVLGIVMSDQLERNNVACVERLGEGFGVLGFECRRSRAAGQGFVRKNFDWASAGVGRV